MFIVADCPWASWVRIFTTGLVAVENIDSYINIRRSGSATHLGRVHPSIRQLHLAKYSNISLLVGGKASRIWVDDILNSWFRASWFSVNKKGPTRCNSMQTFIYCTVTLHVSGVPAPIIRSTKNCICYLWYRSWYWYSYLLPAWPDQATLEGSSCTSITTYTRGSTYNFLVLVMMGAVTPETCRVTVQ